MSSTAVRRPHAIPVTRIAATDADREQIFRLRYAVYVEEMRRPQKDADHHGKRIQDELDTPGHILGAWMDGELVGTVRVNFLRHGKVGYYQHFYGLDQLSASERHHVSITTRMMVLPPVRRSRVAAMLASDIYAFALNQGVRFESSRGTYHSENTVQMGWGSAFVQAAVARSPLTCDDGLSFADALESIGPKDYEQIASCARFLAIAVQALDDADPSRDVNQKLISIRVNYKKLKKWGNYRRLYKSDTARISAKKALEDLSDQLDSALRARDLFAQFSAVLITGPTFTGAQQTASRDEEGKTLALGTIVWESRHFGDETLAPLDVSFGGRVGIQPVLTMVVPDDAAETATAVTGTHQPALVWSVGVHFQKQHRGINAETGFFARTGAAQLTDVPSVLDRGEGSVLSLPVDNGAGKAAWTWESGFEFKMFDNRLAQVHAEKGTTSPQFHLSVSWKNDVRFRRAGALADFNWPQQRLVFRMMIDAIQVLDRRAFGQEAKPFTFGFAVEHERSLFQSGQVVPSATRYLIRGSLNLIKGLASTDLPKDSPQQ